MVNEMKKRYRIQFKNGETTEMVCNSGFDVAEEIAKWADSDLTIDNVKSCDEVGLDDDKKTVRKVKVKDEWLEREQKREQKRIEREKEKLAEEKDKQEKIKALENLIKDEHDKVEKKRKERKERKERALERLGLKK